ncbi:MAG: endonuclease MutS2, partial [Nitrospinota bacterium]
MWRSGTDFSQEGLEVDEWKALIHRYTHSPPGRKALQEASPRSERSQVHAKLRETSEAKEMLLRGWGPDLRTLADLSPLLDKVESGQVLDREELLPFRTFFPLLKQTKTLCTREPGTFPYLEALAASLPLFTPLHQELQNTLGERGEILDTASPALAKIRRTLRQVKEAIRQVLESLLQAKRTVVQEPLVTIKNDRYVLPLKPDFRKQLPGIVHGQSGSGATLFVEPLQVLPLNNRLQQLKSREAEEIYRILQRLSAQIRTQAAAIRQAMATLGELDFIFARARFSIDFHCTEPLLNEEGYIELRQARHPLLEDAFRQAGGTQRVVPIDLSVGKTFRTLVITGPNTGGKTVILKTVGLLTFITLLGSHIPAAEGSSIGLFRQIFADIGDRQSLFQNLSTFSAHMLHINTIVREADERSLVLLDEVGTGTDPAEGAALGMAILDSLTERGVKTVATTHHNVIKTYAFTHPHMMNASVEFEEATLQPTYRLRIGQWGPSNALAVAEMLGLPAPILTRARELLAGTASWHDAVTQQFAQALRSLEQEREALQQERTMLQQRLTRYQRLYEEVEREKAEWRERRRQEGEALLRQARHELEQLVHEIRQQGKEGYRVAFPRKRFQQIAKTLDTAFPAPRPLSSSRPISLGTPVAVPRWKLQGVVVGLYESAGVLEVQCGERVVKVPRSMVEVLEESSPESLPSRSRQGTRPAQGFAFLPAQESTTGTPPAEVNLL